MSTEPTPTSDAQSMTTTQSPTDTPATEITARGREDPWAADDEPAMQGPATARAQRQFDPRSIARLRNLMDDENAYCN
jgi:hypothetical protein